MNNNIDDLLINNIDSNNKEEDIPMPINIDVMDQVESKRQETIEKTDQYLSQLEELINNDNNKTM